MRKSLKGIIAIALAATMTFNIPCYTQNKVENVQAADEYEVVWEDDFNGNSLNRNYWNVEQNGDGGGNQELQYYRDSPDNIEVSNGTLKIKGLRQGWGGKSYTSGRINTKGKAEFRYGKIEAKMKLPSFQGAWPAFWMLGGNHSSVGWPRCGEVDIMEAINTERFTHGALHWYGENGTGDSGGDSKSILPADFDRTQWHVYGLEWNESTMNFLVDGKIFFSDSISEGYKGEFRKEQFIIFNLAIGGQWPGFNVDNSVFPVTMEVDYVKVSQKQSEKNIITGSGVTEKRPNLIPKETVTRNVLEGRGPWSLYFNNAVVKGSGKSTGSSGFNMNIDYLGVTPKAIRSSFYNVNYVPGETYKYSFDIKSSINKNVIVQVVGEDTVEDAFANYAVSLQAGKTYHFSNNVKIDKNYDGRLDLVVQMGGRIGGEYMEPDTSLSIEMSNVEFVGKIDKNIKVPEQPTTKVQGVSETTTSVESPSETMTSGKTPIPTTKMVNNRDKTDNASTVDNSKPKKAKIKQAKRSANGSKISLTLTKIKDTSGYQIKYAVNKKFKKAKTKTVKKLKYTIQKLKNNKVYYIKARAYKYANGKKVFGAWSSVKTVKKKAK